jgi:hypothetical protein
MGYYYKMRNNPRYSYDQYKLSSPTTMQLLAYVLIVLLLKAYEFTVR